ncbi:MAG: hypothetical protein NTY07_19530 [Bacteroidia bacterium]|nr:hypothetical protein [Bacteroidia bacterium]
MKINFAFNLVLALLMFTAIKAQAEIQDSTAADSIRNMGIPVEKVYLHLDRPYYSAGDNIWFKAYLVDGLTNKLSDNSNNLYVELISPESKLIKRLNIRIDKGIGTGDFNLIDSKASGNYLIRAYTNWMRNFGENFFYEREIAIKNQISTKVFNQPKQEESNEMVDVQFFPEGGPLIENVNTIIGFKAINASGYGCNVKGKVISSVGDSVTSFSGTHLGMGSFTFISKKGLNYFAAGYTGDGIPFKVKLPDAIKTGYSLKVSDVDDEFFKVTINTNQETLDQFPLQELVIVGTSHNSLCVTAQFKVKNIAIPVNILKSEFPDGIARMTLMDKTGKIYCERIFNIRTKENYKISVVPDSKVYAPRQKVTLHITVKDTSNNSVPAYLSVSVVDGNQVKDLENKSCISSYLLLESEIRGNIEQPYYYFDPTVTDRYNALDNLLLTQGWRNYTWDYLSDTTLTFGYPVEKGLNVSGRLRLILADKPIVNASISMCLGNTKYTSLFKVTTTDSKGKYNFEGLNFTGRQNIMLCATNKLGMNNGLLSLDSIYPVPAAVNYNLAYKPEMKVKDFPELNGLSNNMEETSPKYISQNKYHLTDTIPLHEISIIGEKPKNEDGHLRMYGEPDFSLTVTDKMYGYQDVAQVLMGRVAGLYITGDPIIGYGISFRRSGYSTKSGGQTPLLQIDGREASLNEVLSLPVLAVDKIEVLKDGGKLALYGFRGSFGVISIFTKRGDYGSKSSGLYSINQPVYGYYRSRTFYSPKYDVQKPENEKPDLRTTIHWEPNIVTDTNGNATVSFYNADNKANVIVDVQGIAESGIPLTGKTSYTVK